MIRTLLFALFAASLSTMSCANEMASATPDRTEPTTIARGPSFHFVGGRWFDGTRFLAAVDGRLTSKRPSRVDVTIDLKGRYVVPPFIEAHNHDLQNSWNAGRTAAAYMTKGIFYSAQLCTMPSDVAGFRSFLGTTAAPDTLYADGCLSSSDGHPLGVALAGAKQAGMTRTADDIRDKHYWAIDTIAELDAKWPMIAEAQPKLIKVILIDSPNYTNNRKSSKLFGFNGIDPALVPEIVRRARAIESRVAAHVDAAADFANAVSAGVDIVAHLPGYRIAAGKTVADYRITDEAIAEAAKRRIAVITTTAASRYDIARNPDHTTMIRASYLDNIRRLQAAGVVLLIGSDVYEGSVLDEVESLDALNAIPRAELLRALTMTNARVLFPDRNIGQFGEGAEASLVALPGNPLTDLSMLRRPALLVKRGAIVGANN